MEKLLLEAQQVGIQPQVILINTNLKPDQLVPLFNEYSFYSIMDTKVSLAQLSEAITEALHLARKEKQDEVLFHLFGEQNDELKKLSKDLEGKIRQRQMTAEANQTKITETNRRALILQQCLVDIHQSVSVSSLEKSVMESLNPYLPLKWFRIQFDTQQVETLKTKAPHVYSLSLSQEDEDHGHMLFSKDDDKPFTRQEKSILSQVSDAVNLSLQRIVQMDRNKELLSQWQATFNAISDPVAIIDKSYNIVSANKSYQEHSLQDLTKKCHMSLFGRSLPCTNCTLGEGFRMKDASHDGRVFDVHSQKLTIDHQEYYVLLYRNISKQLGFERQLLESAKLAELGTIGSSIAHELNNPLGGMINFLQLILMDLKPDHEMHEDITEMEAGAQKCKVIIKNLLGFSRHSELGETRTVNLYEVLQQSLLITELRTRALGIRIETHKPNVDLCLQGRFNQLAHAFCNLLQNSYEAIVAKQAGTEALNGLIEIFIEQTDAGVEVKITDNGLGINESLRDYIFDPLFTTKDSNKNPGLGLTLAQQIFSDHKIKLELTPENKETTTFRLFFPAEILTDTTS